MAKSRLTLSAVALSILSQPAAAQETMTAEQVVEAFEKNWPTVRKIDCPDPTDDEEIVVCARRNPYRVGPSPPVPGARVRGEMMTTTQAMGQGSSRCSTVGRNQSCSGGLPLIPIALFLVDAAGKAVQAMKEEDE